jgi:hypothetical protein
VPTRNQTGDHRQCRFGATVLFYWRAVTARRAVVCVRSLATGLIATAYALIFMAVILFTIAKAARGSADVRSLIAWQLSPEWSTCTLFLERAGFHEADARAAAHASRRRRQHGSWFSSSAPFCSRTPA